MAQENPRMFKLLYERFRGCHAELISASFFGFRNLDLILLLFLFFLVPNFAFAQQKPQKIKHVNSEKIEKNPKLYQGNLFFTGNVIFQQGASVLKADTVVFYEKENRIKAFSNTRLTKGDQTLTAKYLDYNGNTKMAFADGNVVLTETEQTLTSDKLTYNMNTNIAVATGEVVLRKVDGQTLYTNKLEYNRNTEKVYYNNGGTIVSKDNTINSKVGIFDLKTGSNTFDGDVSMTNKDYVIEGKGVQHYSKEDYMEFNDKTVITSRKNPKQYIETTKGKYYLNKKEAFLENRSSVHSDGTVLTADEIYFNQETGYGKGEGDVLIDNQEEKQFICGGFGEFFQKQDSAYVTQDAYAVRGFEKDSLYLHADTLMSTKRQEKNLIRAYNKAKFFKSNLQGKADSISFSEAMGQIRFFRKPVVWSSYRQITGDTIFVYMNVEAERLDSIEVKQNAFAISKTDSLTETQFHQLKSREMLGIFVNEELDWVQAEGNAQTLQYMEDEKKDSLEPNLPPKKELVGINRSDCGIVEANFEEREINVISCKINATSKLYPPSKLPENERKLPDFLWRINERPKVWRDIFVVEN